MSKEKLIYDQLEGLNTQYVQHKKEYEDWTRDNAHRVGSEDYHSYVTQFKQWEAGVMEKKKMLYSELPVAGAEVMLRDTLAAAKPMEFLMAMMTMSMKDKSFLTAVLTAHQHFLRSNEMKRAILENVQPVLGPAPNPNAPVAFNPSVPPPTYRGIGNPSYGYAAGRTDLTAAAKKPIVKPDWISDPAMKRAFRPPSPVAEYKANTLPFKDFSQT